MHFNFPHANIRPKIGLLGQHGKENARDTHFVAHCDETRLLTRQNDATVGWVGL